MERFGLYHRGLAGAVLLAFVFFAVQASVRAQGKQVLKVVLVESGVKGLTRTQSEDFFAALQKKVSQYEMLSVYLENDVKKELSPTDRAALDKCSALSCLQQVSAKIGIERIILCSISLQGNTYHFESSEYGVKSSQKLSDVREEAVCSSSTELNDYMNRIAVVVGQKATRTDYVPDLLKTSTATWWWYAGGAAVVGLGTGIYFLTKKSSTSSATEQALPGAPTLP